MSNITYTFPDQAAIPAPLRGKTFTGGKLARHMIGGAPVEVVMFAELVNGQTVAAKVAGKPELEAAVAAIKAAEAQAKADAQTALEIAVPGAAAYEAAMRTYANAAAAYDRASERGYPAKEAAAAQAADAALQAVFAQYPATALWSKIISYTQASNYSKSGVGEAAKKAVLAGENIAQAVEKMEADWLAAAQRAVDNS
jgi:hypothetical protein